MFWINLESICLFCPGAVVVTKNAPFSRLDDRFFQCVLGLPDRFAQQPQ